MGKILQSIKYRMTLYITYLRTNLKELRSYDIDFFVGVISALVSYAAELFALKCIFGFVYDINGWSFEEVLLIYGLNLTGYSLWACFFINTITLPFYIRRGEFDRFLLRPLNPITQIMMDGFDEDAWGELILGCLILGYAWKRLELSAGTLVLMGILAVAGCFIYAGISILLSGISFFTISQANVANMTSEIKTLAQYPMSIYPKWIQFIFTFIFPVSFISFIPAGALLGRNPGGVMIMSVVIAFLFYRVSVALWNQMERKYESTGN